MYCTKQRARTGKAYLSDEIDTGGRYSLYVWWNRYWGVQLICLLKYCGGVRARKLKISPVNLVLNCKINFARDFVLHFVENYWRSALLFEFFASQWRPFTSIKCIKIYNSRVELFYFSCKIVDTASFCWFSYFLAINQKPSYFDWRSIPLVIGCEV